MKMCFHGNQPWWAIKHPFISLYLKYQSSSFICLSAMLAPVISSLDEIYCTFCSKRKISRKNSLQRCHFKRSWPARKRRRSIFQGRKRCLLLGSLKNLASVRSLVKFLRCDPNAVCCPEYNSEKYNSVFISKKVQVFITAQLLESGWG